MRPGKSEKAKTMKEKLRHEKSKKYIRSNLGDGGLLCTFTHSASSCPGAGWRVSQLHHCGGGPRSSGSHRRVFGTQQLARFRCLVSPPASSTPLLALDRLILNSCES